MIGNRMFPRGAAVKGGPSANYRIRTARRLSRHRLRTFIIIAVVIFAGAGVTFLFLNPPMPPTVLLDNAKMALKGAVSRNAPRYSEATFRTAERLMKEGWMEMARQNGRLAPFRDYRAADSLLQTAYKAAMDAAAQSVTYVGNLQTLTLAERNDLYDELRSWEEALNGNLNVLQVKRYWYSAELALHTSDRLTRAGEYEEARDQLGLGRTWLKKLSDAVTTADNDHATYIKIWRRWVAETIEQSRAAGSYAIIVDKSVHKTYLIKSGNLFKTYNCELGYGSARQKMFSGDGATPEGKYQVTLARHRGSRYYKALMINYPNESDQARFRENKARGVISHRARIGGLIEIHGEGGRGKDWTEGCVALTNKEMDSIMQYVTTGTPVTIVRRLDMWP
ncbi:MAG: L,D-transpeptidase [Candidatus Zixiibacteriota bacterium]